MSCWMSRVLAGCLLVLVPYGWAGPPPAAADVRATLADGNSVGLTVVSNGLLGNNFTSRDPSMEYPLGSAEEHLVRAGLWIGAVTDEGDTLVSTVITDGYAGDDGKEEFTPASNIVKLSVLKHSEFYDPEHAVSHLDVVCAYQDQWAEMPPDDHRPLGVRIDQATYQFDWEPANAVVFLNLTVRNVNEEAALHDMYVGLYAEFASGWKDGHDSWPPSGWYERKDIAYVDSLRLMTEHHFQNDGGNCTSHAGATLLATDDVSQALLTPSIAFNWYNWDPSGMSTETPGTDAERYACLSNRQIDATEGSEAPHNDPVLLLSVGPLGHDAYTDGWGEAHLRLDPGDSLMLMFALLGGAPNEEATPARTAAEDIAYNANWAHEFVNSGLTSGRMTLGLVQNPCLTQHLDIHLAAPQFPWRADPTLELAGEPIELTLLDSETALWMGEYELSPATDSLTVSACVEGFGGQLVCETETWRSAFLRAGEGGVARSADGHIRVAFPGGAVPYDAYILSSDLKMDEGGYSLEIGPAALRLRRAAELKITLPPEDESWVAPGSAVTLYAANGEQIAACYDPAQREVTATLETLGHFRLALGESHEDPGGTPAGTHLVTARPSLARSTVLFHVESPRAEEGGIWIYGPTGRLVSHLSLDESGRGRAVVPWDFGGRSVQEVPSGLYYFRVRVGTNQQHGRFLVVR